MVLGAVAGLAGGAGGGLSSSSSSSLADRSVNETQINNIQNVGNGLENVGDLLLALNQPSVHGGGGLFPNRTLGTGGLGSNSRVTQRTFSGGLLSGPVVLAAIGVAGVAAFVAFRRR